MDANQDSTHEKEGQPSHSKRAEQGDQEMDFEFVSLSESGVNMRRTDSYEQATNLENSSDFCNGFPNSAVDLVNQESSTVDLPPEGGNESEQMLSSMEIVEIPPSGGARQPSTENVQEVHRLRHDNRDEENAEDGNVDKPQKGKTGISHEAEGAEIKDSGSLSTENTLYEPSRGDGQSAQGEGQSAKGEDQSTQGEDQSAQGEGQLSQGEGDIAEHEMIESLKTLEVRKRKSPEREIPDTSSGKKLHLSEKESKKERKKPDAQMPDDGINEENISDGKDIEDGKDDIEDNDEDEKDDDGDDEDDDGGDDDEDGENATGAEKSGTRTKKKHQRQRKKKKLEYQAKKGQLVTKPADDKANKSKTVTSQKTVSGKVDKPNTTDARTKPQSKEAKTEDNKKLMSQTTKESEIKRNDSEKSEEHQSNKEMNQSAAAAARNNTQQKTNTHEPGRVQIPVIFSNTDKGDKTAVQDKPKEVFKIIIVFQCL